MVVAVTRDDEPRRFCTLAAPITERSVAIDGRTFVIANGTHSSSQLRKGCNLYGGPVVLPNCEAWDDNHPPRLIRTLSPFYADGTCNGSAGGALLDDAPTIIVKPGHVVGGPS